MSMICQWFALAGYSRTTFPAVRAYQVDESLNKNLHNRVADQELHVWCITVQRDAPCAARCRSQMGCQASKPFVCVPEYMNTGTAISAEYSVSIAIYAAV